MTHKTRRVTKHTGLGTVLHMECGDVDTLIGCGRLPLPLSREEEHEALLRSNAGDISARNMLVERNLRLAGFIARKFINAGIGFEDLTSIGVIGLIKAVNSFDMGKNTRLVTYAAQCIRNEILMALRRTRRLRKEISFDEPIFTNREGDDLLLSDVLGTQGDTVSRGIDEAVERQMLLHAIAGLDSREKMIMDLRYGLNNSREYTQQEIADLMGVSQSRISRLEKRIIKQLQTELLNAM